MGYKPDLDTVALPILFVVSGALTYLYYRIPFLFYAVPVALGYIVTQFKNENCDTKHVERFFNGFRVGGHRGSPHIFPENSMSGFIQAKAEGADLIEFDVALTKDGKAVLLHDDDLDRTTNLTGPIRDRSFSELVNIDVAHRFERIVTVNGVRPAAAEGIPTLEEIVKWSVQNKVKMLFDVKDSDVELVRQIAELFEQYQLYDKAIVCSFFPNVLWRIKRGNQKIVTGLTWRQKFFSYHDIENRRPRYTGLKQYVFEAIDMVHVALLRTVTPWFLGADLLLTNNLDISECLINEQQSWGRRVVVWTVNDLAEMHWMVEKLGIPVLTDHPYMIKELDTLKQLRGKHYLG
jgi:glycerophosphoinositol glycerophosphodiesterase